MQPILSDHCFNCHGPDEKSRKAKLRLDVREDAVREAIVLGKADDSELIFRLHSTDPDELMPPPETKKPLTAKDKEILERWINEGAEYETHWAFLSPKKPFCPPVKPRTQSIGSSTPNLIPKLLRPPRAPPTTFCCAASPSISTGIAPTSAELAAFDGDMDTAVTRFFHSPRYAEYPPANGSTSTGVGFHDARLEAISWSSSARERLASGGSTFICGLNPFKLRSRT